MARQNTGFIYPVNVRHTMNAETQSRRERNAGSLVGWERVTAGENWRWQGRGGQGVTAMGRNVPVAGTMD